MLERYFQLSQHGTNVRTEMLAGLTTFVTMAYIIVVNPAILEAAGIPPGPSMVATILTAVFGTLLMGVYAKRPFAIAPYMGENAFIAYTVCKVMGYSWQAALTSIFLAGFLFAILTIFKVRSWLAESIPHVLKLSFPVGIGLFLTFIGLNETGLVRLGVPGAPLKVGAINSTTVLLAIAGFILIGALMVRKVRGFLLWGILAITLFSLLLGVSETPKSLVSLPPSIAPIFFQLDFAPLLDWRFWSVVMIIFVMAFVDTIGTLLGVSARAGLLDEKGDLPQIEKPMLVDSLATMFAAASGTTTAGAYIESAAGVEAGGRTGLTAVFTALFFALALFFTPLWQVVPFHASGPALIMVGLLMLSPIKQINFQDYTEFIPAFSTVVLMCFTFNIAMGITAGFVLYPLFKIVAGRANEVKAGVWFLAALSLLFFVFYPY